MVSLKPYFEASCNRSSSIRQVAPKGYIRPVMQGYKNVPNDNITLLLSKLLGVTNRQAKFKTVITLMTQTTQQRFEGIVKGAIAQQYSTALGKNGFGYDPVFIHKGHTKTFAQMALKEKIN